MEERGWSCYEMFRDVPLRLGHPSGDSVDEDVVVCPGTELGAAGMQALHLRVSLPFRLLRGTRHF